MKALASAVILAWTIAGFAEPSIPGYLSAEQQSMLKGVKKLDKDGYLLEMTYTADSHFDEVVKLDDTEYPNPNYPKLHKLLVPASTYCEPEEIPEYGCSVFYAPSPAGKLVGRNYDWFKTNTCMTILHCPADPDHGIFASVGMADSGFSGVRISNFETEKSQDRLLDAPYYTMDGINEKGFAIAILILDDYPDIVPPALDGKFVDTDKPNLDALHVVRYLLNKATDVKHAIRLLEGFDVYTTIRETNFHWLMADKSGNAKVVEFHDGKTIVVGMDHPTQTGKALSVSNYPLWDTEIVKKDGYVDGRLRKRAMDFGLGLFGGEMKFSEVHAMNLLRSVKLSEDFEELALNTETAADENDPYEWFTAWSVVYNLDKLQAKLAIREDYSKIYEIGLK